MYGGALWITAFQPGGAEGGWQEAPGAVGQEGQTDLPAP